MCFNKYYYFLYFFYKKKSMKIINYIIQQQINNFGYHCRFELEMKLWKAYLMSEIIKWL